MSVLGGNPLLLGSGDAAGFTTQRSVRLRSSNSANFSRTFAANPTVRTKFHLHWIVKRGSLGTDQRMFSGYGGASGDSTFIIFNSSNNLVFNVGGSNGVLTSNAVFRDPSAWYIFDLAFDSTQATAANRAILWVNGVQQTWASGTVTLNGNPEVTLANGNNKIGSNWDNSLYFDGYFSEFYFIDGQALTPSAFGEYDAVRNTQWKPKRYTGTYGTNGFYLNFSDNSNNTAATIGKDSSGNSNNWTPNGISVTAGITYDSMTDVPTLTSETASNFATLNPVDTGGGSVTLSGGNLNYSIASGAGSQVRGTIGADLSSKWYWEYTNGTTATALNPVMFGISTVDGQITNNSTSLKLAAIIYTDGVTNYLASKYINGAGTSVTTQFRSAAIGDIFQIAYDAATGNLWFGKNNTWYDATNGTTGNPSTGANPVFTLPTGSSMTPFLANLGATYTGSLNCGQRPFVQPVPTGFKSLNTYNLPDGNVTSSDDYHKIYSYTGNGGGLQVGEIQKPASLFNLDRSLRFRSSASAYLSRTPASATNRKKWTWSGWVKRGALGVNLSIMGAQANGNSNTQRLNLFWQATTDTLCINDEQINISTNFALVTTRTFKDPSKWYHILVLVDTTQATSSNRLKLYIDGIQETVFSTAVYPSLNFDSAMNNTVAHYHGYYNNLGTTIFYNDGYLADIYLIDGQALDPTSFGTYDGNFYWTPKAYTGTYGTNGFHLEFEDFSAATAAAIGKDTSGNGNNWTPSAGINLTTPANTNTSWDSMVDVPTLTSADVANFCTLNPLAASTSTVPTQGNLYLGNNAVNNFACVATLGVSSGKWYWELKPDSNFVGVGVTPLSALPANTWTGASGSQAKAYYSSNGQKYDNGTGTAYGATWTSADLIGVALDMDAGTITFYKNGTSQGVAFTGLTGVYYPVIGGPNTYNSGYINFGQRPFQYSNFGTDRPAATFKSLNSFNVAEILGDVETPDFVWIKSRSASGDHALFNSVVGAGKYFRSNSGNGEVTDVNSLIQFNKNGFLLGNAAIVNTSATTYVASVWKAGNTTVTNTAGTISSQVRANPSAGFSIVTYTGTGANATVGHGLGVAPKMIIIKSKTVVQDWAVYHSNLTSAIYWLQLNGTGTQNNNAAVWNSTAPTSSVFSVGTASVSNATSGLVAYCFADVNGFSKFGSYISNNATDGPFVYTGFRPRWLMVKRAIVGSGTGGWFMYDAERNTYNVMDKYLFAEGTAGDNTLAVFDFTSNGFKIRSNNVHVNTTAGDTYIYMAFAEHPFKYALAR